MPHTEDPGNSSLGPVLSTATTMQRNMEIDAVLCHTCETVKGGILLLIFKPVQDAPKIAYCQSL